MNELNRQPMLTSVQPKQADVPNSEADLGALAEHLTSIADALRRSTGTSKISAPSVGEVSYPLPSSDRAHSPVHSVHPDAKMHRTRYGDLAREAYAVRRRRNAIFDNDELFTQTTKDADYQKADINAAIDKMDHLLENENLN